MIATLICGDVDSYADCFTTDANVRTADGALLSGASHVARELRRTFARGRFHDVELDVTALHLFESMALENGRYRLTFETETGTVAVAGRFTAVWKREHGQWKIESEAVRSEA